VHYREILYEGDEDNRKTLRRTSRPKRKVNHMKRQYKLMTVRKIRKSISIIQSGNRIIGAYGVKMIGILVRKI